ncbi:MAG TPA: mechanosensitive ion channel family protein [Thermoanaerobaculia bacterium]
MKGGARLLWPLLLAAFFGVLHWAVRNNPGVIRQAKLEYEPINNVSRFLIYIAVAFFIVRAVDYLVFDLVSRRRNVKAPVLLREIVSIFLFLILLTWAASFIFTTKVTAFLAGGTVLAAVLGLALQETLGNLFAGIALALEDSFEVGDVIRSGEHIGVVEALRWRGTRLRTFQNHLVIVPNSVLARAHLEVFPRHNLNARILRISVDKNVPPAVVLEVLAQAASHVDGVSTQLPAFARVAELGETGVTYEIKYHMADYSERDRIDADIRKAVWYALRRNDISIPYPIRTHVNYEPPSARLAPDVAKIAERLARIDLLSPLAGERLDAIAAATRVHTFAKGETILLHGTPGNSMFVVHDGTVSVRVDEAEVARLGEGDVFGEMALLTGESRTADVVALSDVTVIEITKEALQPVLRDHPDLAASISSKVAERRGSLDSLRNESHEEAQRTVVSRIRHWFGL